MTKIVTLTDELGGQRAQYDIDADYRLYLSQTDWYLIRKQETGEQIPDDIKQNRAAARAAVQSSFGIHL